MIGLIREAAARLEGVVSRTPVVCSASLGGMLGVELCMKLENMQKTGSFKARGAYNRISTLDDGKRRAGVVAASSGNHAQGVAWAAARLGVRSVIVMPETAPIIKQVATRGYGGEVVLHGRGFEDAMERALELASEQGLTLVHAFDDDFVIAGQGTVGLEIMEELADADTVVVPVGGGGLISGISTAVKALNPSVRVVGVEAAASPSCSAALEAGRPVDVAPADTIADGIAIKRLCRRTLSIIAEKVDDVVTVDEDAIAAAVLKLLERKKLMVEGAGATALAACMEGKLPPGARKVVLVASGGNMDVTTLDRIIRLGLLREGRIRRISTLLRDAPGELARLTALLAARRSNILEVTHERDRMDVPVGKALIHITIEVEDGEHGAAVTAALKDAGYRLEGPSL